MPEKLPETVILVDDSMIDNRLHKRVILRTGLVREVLCFSMAEDALAYLRDTGVPVDLILLDINMPRMNGFEMLDAALQEHGDAFDPSVVVMLTTSLDQRDRDRAAGYSVIKDYFHKPLTKESFVNLFERISPAGPVQDVA